jgi:hypothetical protein
MTMKSRPGRPCSVSLVPSGGLNSYASEAIAASSLLVHRENRGTLLTSSIFASFRRATRGSYCSGSPVSPGKRPPAVLYRIGETLLRVGWSMYRTVG